MSIPTPKFAIGQQVFSAEYSETAEQHPCPDCGGSREWKIVTPNGVEHKAPCQRCSSQFTIWDIPSLNYLKAVPKVRTLTIGSVRIDTNDEHQVSYMCSETGVGSGMVWYEERLFKWEADALSQAIKLADAQNAKINATPEALSSRYFSYLTLRDATTESARQEIYRSWAKYKNLREEIQEVLDDESRDDLRERLVKVMEWDGSHRDWHKQLFQELIDAATLSAEAYGDANLAQVLARIPSAKVEAASA